MIPAASERPADSKGHVTDQRAGATSNNASPLASRSSAHPRSPSSGLGRPRDFQATDYLAVLAMVGDNVGLHFHS